MLVQMGELEHQLVDFLEHFKYQLPQLLQVLQVQATWFQTLDEYHLSAKNKLNANCCDLVLAKQEVVVSFVGQHYLQEVEASRLVAGVEA